MAYSLDFPELKPEHVRGAQLYANRYELVRGLRLIAGCAVVEVGVAHGEFSEFLIKELNPAKFVAIDLFDMERYPTHWGTPQELIFQGKTHYQFYKDRFAHLGDRVTLKRGLSHVRLVELPFHAFDLIYVDAGHDYENVKRDGVLSISKLKPSGTIIFNDYVMYDPFINSEYGVVQAVNEIVDEGGWKVTGFALEKNMFCDIAIQRA